MYNEQGNNLECAKTYQIKVLLYTQESKGEPGVKYFFPDIPFLNDKNIVGIDANLNSDNLLLDPLPLQGGDLQSPSSLIIPAFDNLLRISQAKNIFCTIYDQDNTEKFYNVPLRSFFMIPNYIFGTPKVPRRIKPYYGKINTRKSFMFIPVNYINLVGFRYFVKLTFYYN